MVPTYRVTGDHLQEECLGKITPEKDLLALYWMKLKEGRSVPTTVPGMRGFASNSKHRFKVQQLAANL